jgi:O-antigen ligase/polysaccharide polymerase Wzy-like membrane protein
VSTVLLLSPGLLVIGGLGIALLEVLVRRAEVAAAMVLGSVVIQATLVDGVPSLLLPGGTRVYVTDIVSGLLVGAALARLLRLRRFGRFHRWGTLLGAVLLVSLVRGVMAFGAQASIADFRQYLFFAGAALYFATFAHSLELNDRIGRTWLVMTVPMMALVAVRWLAAFTGIDLGVPAEKYGADAAIRVIDGPYNFFLAHAFVMTIPAWLHGERTRWLRWTSVMLLLFVLLLNRRTVWLAILVGVAVLMLRDRQLGRRAVALVVLGAVLTAVAFVALGGLQEAGQPVVKSGSGTLSWRVEGWSELVGVWSQSSTNWAVGEPFGSGFAREIEGIQEGSHPHNFFIETMIRTGLAGLVSLVALTAGLLRALWRAPVRDAGLLGTGVLPALLAMQLVWCLTWVPGSEQGIVTGLAIAAAAASAWHRTPHPRPLSPTAHRVLTPAGNGRL